MECIECRVTEANKESGLCQTCEGKEERKINGLLYLPALGLVLGIIGGALGLYNSMMIILSYFDDTGFMSYYSMGVIGLLILGFAVSLYAAWLFFRRKKGTRKAMVIYYVTGLIVALYLTILPVTLFDAKMDTDSIRILSGSVFGVVIWVPYFLLSKRINTVFCR